MTFGICGDMSAGLGRPSTAGLRGFLERRRRIGGNVTLGAAVIAVGLTASTMPTSAGPLPPLPNVVTFTNAYANDDGGAKTSGGSGISDAEANGVYHVNTNAAVAGSFGDSVLPQASPTSAQKGMQ